MGIVRDLATRAAQRVGNLLYATDGRDMLVNSPDGWEVDQPWLWWDGPAGGDGTGGPWGNPPPGADHPNLTRALPAMARCRSLIADQLAGVPWEVYRGSDRLPSPDWLTDPQGMRADGRVQSSVIDVRLSAVEFWSAMIISAVEHGEGVIYVPNRSSDGSPVPPLFLLNPADVKIDGGSYYVRDTRLDPQDLIIVRNRVWPGKMRGWGVWRQFAESINFGKSITDYAGGMLGRGIPAGYLKVSAPDLSQTEAESLRDRWMAAHGGTRRRIAVLNAVTEFKPLQFDPQALQLTEMMRLSAWEIALVYGIPPYKLGISMGYSQTYANIESQQIDYVTDALLPWARRIESAFDSEFARGTSIKLNLDGLRRSDTRTRYEAHKIALDAGFLMVNEVRAMEDLPPLSDAELESIKPRAPLTLVPNDQQTGEEGTDGRDDDTAAGAQAVG